MLFGRLHRSLDCTLILYMYIIEFYFILFNILRILYHNVVDDVNEIILL